MTRYKFRIYYAKKDSGIERSLLTTKADALARFSVFENSFMVIKEVGWFKRVLRIRRMIN